MIAWYIVLLRIVLAAVLGAVIGLERERKEWSSGAGMRTHMMVCVGSALIIIVSAFGFSDVLGQPHVELDPSRIAAQVISGIGFLGAGTILFLRPGIIRGLTTASGLWTVAAIGLAVGAGMYIAGIITTVVAFIILLMLKPFERKMAHLFYNRQDNQIRVLVDLSADPTTVMASMMNTISMEVENFSFEKGQDGYVLEIRFEKFDPKEMMPQLMEVQKQSGVQRVDWEGKN